MQPMRLSVEKSFKFNQCDFASLHSDDLRRHLKTHTREKLYKCNQCNYASAEAAYLRRHLKIHSGEKSYRCNHCNYASVWLGALRKHQRTHSGKVVQVRLVWPMQRNLRTQSKFFVEKSDIFIPKLYILDLLFFHCRSESDCFGQLWSVGWQSLLRDAD